MLVLSGKGVHQIKINTSATINKYAVQILPGLPLWHVVCVLHSRETGFAVVKLSVTLLWVC